MVSTQRVNHTKPSLIPQPPRATASHHLSPMDNLSISDQSSTASVTRSSLLLDKPELKQTPGRGARRRMKGAVSGTATSRGTVPKRRERPVKPTAVSSSAAAQPPTAVAPRRRPELGKDLTSSFPKVAKATAIPLLKSMPRAHELLAEQVMLYYPQNRSLPPSSGCCI